MASIDYVELHCHSSFSLLDATATPAQLVGRAGDLGMDALALTDQDALYGAVPFITAAQARGIRPILGAEVTLEDGCHLTLLVENEAGWRNLCFLISRARMHMPKGQAKLAWADMEQHTGGLVCLSGCRHGPIASALLRWDRAGAFRMAKRLRALFGPERCWIELQHHLRKDDGALVENLVSLALAETGRYETAREVAAAAPDFAQRAEALHPVAVALASAEDGKTARQVARQVPGAINLAQALRAVGVALAQTERSQAEAAFAEARSVIESLPNVYAQARPLAEQAYALADAGFYDEAWNTAATITEGSGESKSTVRAAILRKLFLDLSGRGAPEAGQALVAAWEACQAFSPFEIPRRVEALLDLEEALRQVGRPDAEIVLDTAQQVCESDLLSLRADYRRAVNLRRLAVSLARAGRPDADRFLDVARKAAEDCSGPDRTMALQGLIEALLPMGQYDAARGAARALSDPTLQDAALSAVALALIKAGHSGEALAASGRRPLDEYIQALSQWAPAYEQLEQSLSIAVIREAIAVAAWVRPDWHRIQDLLAMPAGA